MASYEDCCDIGREGARRIMDFFSIYCEDGRYVATDKGRLSRELQLRYGDFYIASPNGKAMFVELKTEERNRPNLFLETWSNRPHREGWMHQLDCDLLFYHFLEPPGDLYILDFPKLKSWAFGGGPEQPGRMYDYPEKAHNFRPQRNVTCGRCVPIPDILAAVPHRHYRYDDGVFRPVQPRPFHLTALTHARSTHR